MCGMRFSGFSKTCLQSVYEKAFFCGYDYEKAKMQLLRTGIDFHERKMHDLPRKACTEKHRPCNSTLFIQTLEQRTYVQMENAGRKDFFASFCKAFVSGT